MNVRYYERFENFFVHLKYATYRVVVEKKGNKEYIIGVVFGETMYPLGAIAGGVQVRIKVDTVANYNLKIKKNDPLNNRFGRRVSINNTCLARNGPGEVIPVLHEAKAAKESLETGWLCRLTSSPNIVRFLVNIYRRMRGETNPGSDFLQP
ncbi:uncharacterized protein LOC117175715 [Belonocnema kinseyi]|uniref:uncharacterized protein LOC117175715 n=1 Tax=Belonocnema kinseyi TaxID=2817044 RepID=UPI00143D3052|nr:uncharacterized protein LOC117175715 [Belonocnema kinseyi]